MIRFLLASALALSGTGVANAATYQIDPRHAQVLFTYNHQGYAHLSARLNQMSGQVEFDPANPGASSIQVELPMASLSTGVPKLDTHLLSADFFDADKYPTASFHSTKVAVLGSDRLAVTGDLSIHGVTRPVTLAVTVNRVGEHSISKAPMAGFEATATIRRSEFGVAFMLAGVADEVELRINIETSVQATEPAPAAKG
ncbi:MAG: YceI family protein [Arenimonas sp.]